jgi:hypothetical protein
MRRKKGAPRRGPEMPTSQLAQATARPDPVAVARDSAPARIAARQRLTSESGGREAATSQTESG